jgi:hypothetical protein
MNLVKVFESILGLLKSLPVEKFCNLNELLNSFDFFASSLKRTSCLPVLKLGDFVTSRISDLSLAFYL